MNRITDVVVRIQHPRIGEADVLERQVVVAVTAVRMQNLQSHEVVVAAAAQHPQARKFIVAAAVVVQIQHP